MATLFDSASLVMIPSGVKESKLYSIKPTDGSGDFTFSRGTDTATRVNASGLIEKERSNQLPYSNTFNTGWSPVSGTLAQGVTDPFGGNTAWSITATNADPYLYNQTAWSGVLTLSIWAKGVGSSIGKKIQVRMGSSFTEYTLTSEWQRFEHFTSGSAANIGIEVPNPAVAGDVVHIYGAQLNYGTKATDYIETTTAAVYEGITDNLPRLDYSGGASCPSLLLEPQRTNILPHSEYFNYSTYLKDGVTSTDNAAISPEGVQNASSVVESAILEDHRILWNNGFSGTGNASYSMSVFVKKITGQPTRHIYWMCQEGANAIYAHFDMDNFSVNEQNDNGTGSIVDADIVPMGNDWYRLTLSGIISSSTGTYYNQLYFETTPRTGFSAEIYTGNGTSGFEIYGWQIEAGSYPTSYIPTYGTSATRSADACSKTGISSLLPSTEGVFFIDSEINFDANFTILASLRNTSTSNFTNSVYWYITGNKLQATIFNATAFTGWNADTSTLTNGRYKVAIAWKANDYIFYMNGNAIGSTTGVSDVPVGLNLIDLANYIGSYPSDQNIKQALVFQTRLTNAELATLTTI